MRDFWRRYSTSRWYGFPVWWSIKTAWTAPHRQALAEAMKKKNDDKKEQSGE